MKRTQVHLTSLEEIFQFELLFAKICAGFQFEWQHFRPAQCRWLAVAYRLAIVLLTRYLTPKYFITPPSLFHETLGQVPLQNYNVFYYFCQVVGSLMVFVNIHSGFKSHELMLVLLKKRFNADYISRARPFESGQLNDVECEAAQTTSSKARPRLLLAGWLLPGFWTSRPRSSDIQTHDKSRQPPLDSIVPKNFTHVSTARWLMAVNLIVAIYSVHVHSVSEASVSRALATSSKHGGLVVMANSSSPSTAGATNPIAAVSTLGVVGGQLAGWAFLQARFLPGLANLLAAIVQASLNFCQMYGQILVSLLITSSIADMIRYSMAFDEWTSSGDKHRSPSSGSSKLEADAQNGLAATSISSRSDIYSGSGGSSARTMQQHNERLLTIRVLLQAREVLLVIRHAVCVEYLFVLLFDLARFGAIFCLLDESIFNSDSNQKTLPLIGANFAQVLMSILLTRLGYRWVHHQAEQLIHDLDKSTVLADWADNLSSKEYTMKQTTKRTSELSATQKRTESTHISSATQSTGSWRPNRTTALKLAQEIITIWPTDWYKPDYKSCMEQVIYVLTFVATFHQLAEASFRVDSMSQPAPVPVSASTI